MAKKYILNYLQVSKRNRKFFRTSFITKKLKNSCVEELKSNLISNKKTIKGFLMKLGYDFKEKLLKHEKELIDDINCFVKKKKEYKKGRITMKSRFNIKCIEEMFKDRNSFFPNTNVISDKYKHITGSNPPSKSYLTKLLNNKLRIKYTKKAFKHQKSVTIDNFIEKILFIDQFAREIRNNSFFVFADAAKLKNDKNGQRFWNSKDYYQDINDNGRVPGLNILAALGDKKIISYKTFKESVDANCFIDFLKTVETYGKINGVDDIVMILDNCNYQKGKLSKKFISKSKIRMLFLPVYCPTFNSIEYVWNNLKGFARKHVLLSQ